MTFEEQDVMYAMPGRYWEDKTPIKCIVKQTKKIEIMVMGGTNNNSILVYHEGYGHDVYVDRNHLFFSEAKCREAIELYSKLHDLYFLDECDKGFERIFPEIIKKD